MSEVTKNTVGFWKHGNRIVSAWLQKGRIPKSCRLVLVKNSYKEKGDKKPDFIGYFVETKDSDAIDIKRPYAVLRSQIEEDNQDQWEKALEFEKAFETTLAQNLSKYL